MRWLTENRNDITIGGKARNLFRLQEEGFRIPAFGVVPIEFFFNLKQVSETAHDAEWEALQAAILTTFSESTFFAVRSSALEEDGTEHSYAGQFESFLFVRPEDLCDRIREVHQSGESDRAVAYRSQARKAESGVAVIVQQMIDADVSGVAFGLNPVSGRRDEKIINAVYGLGEGLVSGELNADQFSILKEEINYIPGNQAQVRRLDEGKQSGTRLEELTDEWKNTRVLSDEQIREIGSALDKLFAVFNSYQDIEFCWKGNTFFLLQTRPITTVSTTAASNGEYIIWDNSNIIESYPGLTSPYTFSFISKVYEAVYRQFAAMMGVSEQMIEENHETFATMLGLLQGRVYYNLLSWYKALALLPGYHLNAGFMEKMMGVKERFELKQEVPPGKWKERWRVVRLLGIMLMTFWRMPRMKRRFRADFNEKMNRFEHLELTHIEPAELIRLFEDYRETLLKKWKAPLVNDFFAMVFFGVLQKLVEKYQLDANESFHNDLLAGADDIISTQPIHRCIELAESIQATPGAKEWFMKHEPQTIAREIHAVFPQLAKKGDAYIQLFGNRCVGELKLETITYQEDPAAFYQLIRSYVQQDVDRSAFKSDHQQSIRKEAERQVKERLKGKPFKRWMFNWVLKHARRTVSDRENLRFERTRAFGMIRRMTLAMGRQLEAEGAIETQRDIFFLTTDEVADFIRGKSVQVNLKGLIAFRKAEYERFGQITMAERIPTHGLVYVGNDFQTPPESYTLSDEEDAWKGIGCCPGKITARVRVVHDPREVDSLNGDILVTSSTDPGWVTLFPTASGILVERGSLLSHSAIVSREMGKPCIVGINGLLSQLQTGDVVEMDGAAGWVRRIEKTENRKA